MASLSFVSLNVKCPVCSKALMDNEHKVDNESSIKLMVNIGGKKGFIWLSSIWGSFNYTCNVDLPDNEIAMLYCPHCKSEMNSEELCNLCGAPIVSLILDMGGKVSFCSRKGCKNHNIGFEDLTEAMKKLYQEFGFRDKSYNDDYIPLKDVKKPQTVDEENKEIIETGSYLNSYCPHCKKSLITEDMLKLKIINEKDEEGFVMLSPYLNVFSSKSTVYLSEDKTVKDIKCHHCDKSLIMNDIPCELCGSKVAKIMVSARTKMVDFYICSKKGCRWHGVNKKDMEDIRLEDSLEW
jgi:phage FluMu protein Com